jgi:hypothetical protein
LLIKTTAYANVTIQFTHEGRTGKITENWGKSGSGALTIKWTCAYPGVPYHYKVTATDSEGGKKVASGSFEPVSVARCASMKAAEQAAAQAQAQAQLQAEQQAQQQAAAQQQAQYELFVSNCEALGGTPIPLTIGGVPATGCKAPYGGLLNVPS